MFRRGGGLRLVARIDGIGRGPALPNFRLKAEATRSVKAGATDLDLFGIRGFRLQREGGAGDTDSAETDH